MLLLYVTVIKWSSRSSCGINFLTSKGTRPGSNSVSPVPGVRRSHARQNCAWHLGLLMQGANGPCGQWTFPLFCGRRTGRNPEKMKTPRGQLMMGDDPPAPEQRGAETVLPIPLQRAEDGGGGVKLFCLPQSSNFRLLSSPLSSRFCILFS